MRWIAEGYCKGIDSHTRLKHGEERFHEIASLSMMQLPPPHASTVSGCRVNGLFREFLLSRPTEDRVTLPLEISLLQGKCGCGL